MAKAKMETSVSVGDKIRIVNAHPHYKNFYGNGAEGFVVEAYGEGCIDVKFTYGWLFEHDDSREFHVYKEEYEVINNESKTQTKKEKEMGNQIRMKQGVYAVVDTVNGEVLAVDTVREDARSSLQRAKNNGVNAKLVKMQPQKWVR